MENEQKILNQKIPFKVKYPKDYLWQIYYSEYTNQYFMLVTTEDLEYSAFFYLLKKQLTGNKNEKIFVPISYTDYSMKYLTRMQISDIENYLWLFTKQWPLVYEVYDKDDNLSIQITGRLNIYDDIQSEYKIKLRDKEEAIKFYKFLKALFIMKTEMPSHYKFELLINGIGGIEFKANNKKVIYEILSSFIKEEYLIAEDKKINLILGKDKKRKELEKFQIKCGKLEKEYLEKEKQISTFLECKRTFFGRVKYFFKYKKITNQSNRGEEKEENKKDKTISNLSKYKEIKEFYTLQELIDLYKQIDKEEILIKNINLDIKAIKQRIKNIESKVKNATLYIQEINEHQKSIFEFWRFTNKDKQEELPEGERKQEDRENIKKVFDYQLDFEDLAKQLDSTQRELLTKKELDSIFLATTDILEDINKIAKRDKIQIERLEELKNRALEKNILLEKENFDIFGSISYDNKLKTLANQKHRESEKELFKILDINKNTTIEEYTKYIKSVIRNLNSCLKKIKTTIEFSLYKCDINGTLDNRYNVFNIRATSAIKDLMQQDIETINLYKINLSQNTPIIAFANSAYYENNNKTLPLGMNVSESILLDNNLLKLELNSTQNLKIVSYKDSDNTLSEMIIKNININEYELKDIE